MLVKGVLERAVEFFSKTFWTKSSGIVSVGAGNNCIHVLVDKEESLKRIPDIIYVPDPAPAKSSKAVSVKKEVSGGPIKPL